MIISTVGCCISLSLLGTYSYLKDNGYDMAPYAWLPLTCLSLFMLVGSLGVFSLHFTIISEVLAQKVVCLLIGIELNKFDDFFILHFQIRGVVLPFLIFESCCISFLTVKVSENIIITYTYEIIFILFCNYSIFQFC
jgi:hypothetical protein